ncbi:MAG: glycoside hydrolase family 47 protein [Rhodothermaceae bacterium]
MKKISLLLLVFAIVLVSGCNKKEAQPETKINKKEYAEKVKKEFMHAWNAYKKYAWGHDALKPLSKKPHDWYGQSFLMTPVDAFDTMVLMGLDEEVAKTKELIFSKLDFDKDVKVQNFEITIRMLGGLISAYMWDGDERFLKLATDLADRLLPVFNSPTGMPYVFVNLKTGKVEGNINNPAEIGTLLIEFGALSKLTGNNIYYEKAKKAMMGLVERTTKVGLVGTTINVETGEWIIKECHLSGMLDSYFEYLLKAGILFNDKECMDAWKESIVAINKYLADDTVDGLWYSHVNSETGERIRTQFGALDAFFPAVLALGGDLDRAKALQENCFKMWTKFGIEPEQYNYKTGEVLSAPYFLRPENIESAYYLYHYTKDEKYIKMGKTYLESLIKYCRAEEGYSHLESVVTKEKSDNMESFFFAETLKYLYLLFDEEQSMKFDDVIFNTEAHPFKKSFIKN